MRASGGAGRAGYFIRRIKLRPMSSICFSPDSTFLSPLFLSLFSFLPPLRSAPPSVVVHAAPFSPGSRSFMWRLGRKTLPRAAVLFSFSFVEKPSSHTWRGLISKLQARISDTTRLRVFSRGLLPPPYPLSPLPCLRICNALCDAACVSRKVRNWFPRSHFAPISSMLRCIGMIAPTKCAIFVRTRVFCSSDFTRYSYFLCALKNVQCIYIYIYIPM